jgi:hypothetical protein
MVCAKAWLDEGCTRHRTLSAVIMVHGVRGQEVRQEVLNAVRSVWPTRSHRALPFLPLTVPHLSPDFSLIGTPPCHYGVLGEWLLFSFTR